MPARAPLSPRSAPSNAQRVTQLQSEVELLKSQLMNTSLINELTKRTSRHLLSGWFP